MWQLTQESLYSSKVNAKFSLSILPLLQSRDRAQVSREDLKMNLDCLKKFYNKIILYFYLGKIPGLFLCSVPSKKACLFYIMYLRKHSMFTWAPLSSCFGMLYPSWCEFPPKSLCRFHLIGWPLLEQSLKPVLAKPSVEKNTSMDFCPTEYLQILCKECRCFDKQRPSRTRTRTWF